VEVEPAGSERVLAHQDTDRTTGIVDNRQFASSMASEGAHDLRKAGTLGHGHQSAAHDHRQRLDALPHEQPCRLIERGRRIQLLDRRAHEVSRAHPAVHSLHGMGVGEVIDGPEVRRGDVDGSALRGGAQSVGPAPQSARRSRHLGTGRRDRLEAVFRSPLSGPSGGCGDGHLTHAFKQDPASAGDNRLDRGDRLGGDPRDGLLRCADSGDARAVRPLGRGPYRQHKYIDKRRVHDPSDPDAEELRAAFTTEELDDIDAYISIRDD
jgi:hypothetical protein